MSLVDRINALAASVGNKLRDSVLPRLLPAGGAPGQVLSKAGAGDFQSAWSTPSGGIAPLWMGKLYGAMGRCDPVDLFNFAVLDGSVAATPTSISTSIARVCLFRPPADIVVNKIRFYGVGATTGVYQIAVYNATTLERVTGRLVANTVAGAWGAVAAGGISLMAGKLYFIAVSVVATGNTAGMLCSGPTQPSTGGSIAVTPSSWPGNLAPTLGYMDGGFAQFAVTSGALPVTAPALSGQTSWTAGFPALWLDNSSA